MQCTVVLLTMGAPDPLSEEAAYEYLKSFLSDPCVMHFPGSKLLARRIARKRAPKLVEKQLRHAVNGRALLLHELESLERELTSLFDESESKERSIVVNRACLYSPPEASKVITAALATSDEVIILPLFPQFSLSTHQRAYELAISLAHEHYFAGRLEVIWGFSELSLYRILLASQLIRSEKSSPKHPDTVLISFHGLPNLFGSYDTGSYYEQCRNLYYDIDKFAAEHNVKTRLTFQSKFGPLPWLKPYLSEVLKEEAQAGHDVLIMCPGFILECLETQDEVNVYYREEFARLGGGSFTYLAAPKPDLIAKMCFYIVNEALNLHQSADHKLTLEKTYISRIGKFDG